MVQLSLEEIKRDFAFLTDPLFIELDLIEFYEEFWDDVPYWHVTLIRGDTEETALFIYLPVATELGVYYEMQPYSYTLEYEAGRSLKQETGEVRKVQDLLQGYCGTVIAIRKIKALGKEAMYTVLITQKTREVTIQELWERAWER